eukprot:s2202_g11.t1
MEADNGITHKLYSGAVGSLLRSAVQQDKLCQLSDQAGTVEMMKAGVTTLDPVHEIQGLKFKGGKLSRARWGAAPQLVARAAVNFEACYGGPSPSHREHRSLPGSCLQLFQVFSGNALGRSRRSRGNVTLMLGQCGSGKTATFFRLRDGEEVQTVSSLQLQRDSFPIKAGENPDQQLSSVEVIDFPGHLRMRGKANDMLPEARCIIYLVDSDDKPKLKDDVAEHFYELLTNRDMLELHTPILIACNKSDLSTARSEKFIVEEIEREIEQMRVSRGATLEGQDQADSYLGIDGEKFKLMDRRRKGSELRVREGCSKLFLGASAGHLQLQGLELELAQVKDAYATFETRHHVEVQKLNSDMEEVRHRAERAEQEGEAVAQDLEKERGEVQRLIAAEANLKAALDGLGSPELKKQIEHGWCLEMPRFDWSGPLGNLSILDGKNCSYGSSRQLEQCRKHTP